MAKIVKFPPCRTRGSAPEPVSLASEGLLFEDVHVEGLIEDWIVPELVKQWTEGERARSASGSEDNGGRL
ncbi:MAG: hypothetical protein ABIR70_17955 [Bryobacteraceae bacterium]